MRKAWRYWLLAALVQCVAACGEAPVERQAAATATAANAAASVADRRLVVAFGDSLYAGYNLPERDGLAPVLERALVNSGVAAEVVNAGVSGDTTDAGRERLAFTLDGLARKPDLVLVGLGGNDMLRGLSPAATRANLDAILAELKRRGIPAALTGMRAAPNMGPDYARAFDAIYPELAKKFDAPLYSFILEGVIGRRDMMLGDGVHPNAAGVRAIVARLAPVVAGALPARGA